MDTAKFRFGANLRRLRTEAGLSQPALARAVGVTREAVSQWETADHAPKAGRIEDIARALGVEPAALLGDVDAPREPAKPSRPAISGDVPVRSCQRGHGGMLTLGDQVASAPRLPRVAALRDVFAIYAPTDMLAPWRQAGELIYLDPHRPARRGDRVLVEIAGDAPQFVLGELEEPTSKGAMRVRSYNPPQVHTIEPSRAVRIWRAMEWPELVSAA